MKITVNQKQTYIYTGAKELQSEQPSILFVHGSALDHTVWLLQSRYFAHHHYNVIAVDLPGHGKSQGPVLPTITEMSDWLFSVADALDIQNLSLVGHSMGSLVTLEAAARHPKRTTKLALLGSAVPMAVSDPLLNAAKENSHMGFDMINLWGHSAKAHLGGSQTPGTWMVGTANRLLERSGRDVLYNDLNACHQFGHGIESGKKIECPTLMLCGRRDIMTPIKVAQELVAAIPNAKMKILDSGHLLMSEKPNQVLDELIEFFGSAQ